MQLAPVIAAEAVAEEPAAYVLVDSRWYLDGRSGRAAYLAGHLPGARFVDLDVALAAPPAPERGRHPLPEPAVFAAAMAALGVERSRPTVVYDDQGGAIAARLVWMLRALDLEAALLDGGLASWPGPLEQGEVAPASSHFEPRPFPSELLAGIDEVAAWRGLLLDARDPSRFRGEGDPVDPRTGHIPGAMSAPVSANLAGDGRFLEPAALRARFEALGASADEPLISYCGSGVTACHNLLALEYAGLGRHRLFVGSWSQWSSDAARPLETGEGGRRGIT